MGIVAKLPPMRPLGFGVLADEAFAEDTALAVGEGEGALIEAGTGYPFRLVLQDPEDEDSLEVVGVTGADGDTLTLAAGLAGAWPAGTLARRLVTRDDLAEIQAEAIGTREDLDAVLEELDAFIEAASAFLGFMVDLQQGDAELAGFNFVETNTTGMGPFLNWTYSRGTPEAKAASQAGDFVGRLTFNGWHDGVKKPLARLTASQASGTPGSNYIPGIMEFAAIDADGIARAVFRSEGGAAIIGGDLTHAGGKAGFFETAPVAQPTISGWSGKTAEQKADALKDALVALGLVAVS